MTLPSGDLAAYLDRIGYGGTTAAERATLAEIVALHAAAIPFENLDPLLGIPTRLDTESLVAKLVRGGRGGYCFEQNGLLRLVLEQLGFTVTGLAARVLWMQPDDAVTARSHKVLLVALPEGPAIVDVGFGGNTLTGALDLVADVEQATPHEDFRLFARDGEWRQQVHIGGEWRTTYRFDLHPQLAIDYEPINWWTATSPNSHFTKMLTAARALPGKRLTLRNRELAEHVAGSTEQRVLASAGEACDVLRDLFGIRIADRAAVEARIAAVFEHG
jgi:N-hydroxyarylamine O-acetyltransferase